MARQTNRAVGRKFGGLLQGLLGNLYDTSAIEANPEYLPVGQEGPVSKGGNLPFKGSGAFGGLKAKEANADFIGQNLMADQAANRELTLANQLNAAKVAQEEALLGKEGEAAFDVYSRLSPEAQTLGPIGSLPPANADIARLFKSAGGGVTSAKGIAGLGPYVAEQNILAKTLADPKALDWSKGAAAKESFMNIGGDTHVNPATGEALYGRQTSNIQEALPIYEDKFDLTTGTVKPTIVGYKSVSRPVTTPAFSGKLGAGVTQQELDSFKAEEVEDSFPPLEETNVTDGQYLGPKGPSRGITPTVPANSGVAPKVVTPPIVPSVKAGPETRWEGLIPDLGRGVLGAKEAVKSYGKEAAGAAGSSLRIKEIGDILDYLRKQLIRREQVQPGVSPK